MIDIDIDNRKVAAEIARRLRDQPASWNQTHWYTGSDRVADVLDDDDGCTPSKQRMDTVTEAFTDFFDCDQRLCGQTLCVAGHAAHIAFVGGAVTVQTIVSKGLAHIGAVALGLDPDGPLRLFDTCRGLDVILPALDHLAATGSHLDRWGE